VRLHDCYLVQQKQEKQREKLQVARSTKTFCLCSSSLNFLNCSESELEVEGHTFFFHEYALERIFALIEGEENNRSTPRSRTQEGVSVAIV
jgi:hypothetical protein